MLVEMTLAGFYAWNWRDLCGFRCMERISPEPMYPFQRRNEGTGCSRSEMVVQTPSEDATVVTDEGDSIGRKIKVCDFHLSHYIMETICCKIDQIADCTRPQRNIEEAHVPYLRESLLTKEFDYSCGLMRDAFVRDTHPKVTTWGDMVTRSDGGFALILNLHVRDVHRRHRYEVL